MNARLLSIDVGTQSVRALVFDQHGELLDKAQIAIEPYFSSQPGWAEQHASVYWDALCQACALLWQQGRVAPGELTGMALTTQRATLFCLDAHGEPLRPGIVWLDQRKCSAPPPLSGFWKLALGLAGAGDLVAHFQREAEANWIAQHQPEIWSKTSHYLLLSGYLSWRLTGEFVDSVGSQVGYLPFDYKGLQWAKAADFKWQAVPVRREQLPELRAPGSPLGTLSAAAAADLGLPQGLPLIAAAADKACEVLGSGALTPEVAALSYGTTATINTCRSSYLEVQRMLPPYPAALPGAYNTEIQIYRGFWMVSWFKQEFAHKERRVAAEQGVAVESLFDDLIREIPPGSMGLTLQPYWTPGVRDPGPEAKGAIIGFGDVHKRGHFYRAILEGIAYGLRAGAEQIEARSKQPLQRVVVAGGGSQSDVAMQITADVFNRPTSRPHVYETSGLGAAINAAVGLGVHPDYASAVAAMTRPGQQFSPDPDAAALYDQLYRQVYSDLYPRLQPLYQRIRKITGYPA